jgi:hypothetical protein
VHRSASSNRCVVFSALTPCLENAQYAAMIKMVCKNKIQWTIRKDRNRLWRECYWEGYELLLRVRSPPIQETTLNTPKASKASTLLVALQEGSAFNVNTTHERAPVWDVATNMESFSRVALLKRAIISGLSQFTQSCSRLPYNGSLQLGPANLAARSQRMDHIGLSPTTANNMTRCRSASVFRCACISTYIGR